MEYYLVDVKSSVNVNGTEVAFDYINTYFDPKKAVDEAILLASKEHILVVSVHKWVVTEKGRHTHSGDVLYHYEKRMCNI